MNDKDTGKIPDSQGGWIKLYRKFLEWEWYDKSEMVHLFIHLLLSANHNTAKWRGFEIPRGSLITSRANISESTGISEQSVRTCLNRLKSTSEITIKSTNKFTLITLCNYDNYQSNENKFNQQTNQPFPNNQPTTNQQLTTNKKNKKNKKNIFAESFESFWNLYSKKTGKVNSFCEWQKLSEDERNAIFKTLPAYIASIPDPQYRKHPLNYLKGRSWDDEYVPPKKTNNQTVKVDPTHSSPSPAAIQSAIEAGVFQT